MKASQVTSRHWGRARASAQIDTVARPAPPPGEVALHERGQATLQPTLPAGRLLRQPEAPRELPQEVEERQVRPRDRSAGDGPPERRLELSERGLPLDQAAQEFWSR